MEHHHAVRAVPAPLGVVGAGRGRAAPPGGSGFPEVTPRRPDLLSKYKRSRSNLQFELSHARNRYRWSTCDLERDALAQRARALTWQVIDLDERIRDLEYR